jgi:hypothetical protein
MRRAHAMRSSQKKQWHAGELVLHRAAPKVHALLMEVVEVAGERAKTDFLDPGAAEVCWRSNRRLAGVWHSMSDLEDPVLFLKTDEYLQTLQEWTCRGLRSSAWPGQEASDIGRHIGGRGPVGGRRKPASDPGGNEEGETGLWRGCKPNSVCPTLKAGSGRESFV